MAYTDPLDFGIRTLFKIEHCHKKVLKKFVFEQWCMQIFVCLTFRFLKFHLQYDIISGFIRKRKCNLFSFESTQNTDPNNLNSDLQILWSRDGGILYLG